MKRIILLLSLWSGVSAEVLTLDDMIESALLNSPDIKISKADYEISKEQSHQADGDYLPQINLLAEGGKQGVDYDDQKIGTPGNEIQIGAVDTNLLGAKVNAKQLIYDFGKTTGNMRSFENQSYAFKAALQQSISDKIFAVKKAYYDLLYYHALIKVNEENIKLNEQQLNRSQRYYEAGIRTKVDVTDAKVNLIEAQLELENTKYDLQLSAVTLKKEVGIDNDDALYGKEIYIQKPVSENVFESLPKVTKDTHAFKEEAYAQRAELEQYTQLLKSAQSVQDQVDGDYYPSLYANGDYLVQKVDDDAFAPEQQWKASVSLEWNLYSGSKTSAQSEQARLAIIRSQADLDNARLRIQKEVNDAYIQVNKQRDATKLSENLSSAAKEKFEQVQKRYEYGLADYIELQQARQSYIDAQARLHQTYYQYFTALAQLDRSVGK
jgi:outer membrane protein